MRVIGNQPLSTDEIRTLLFEKSHRLYPLIAGRKINLGEKEGHTEDGDSKKEITSRQAQLHLHQVYGWLHVSAFSEKAIIRRLKNKKAKKCNLYITH